MVPMQCDRAPETVELPVLVQGNRLQFDSELRMAGVDMTDATIEAHVRSATAPAGTKLAEFTVTITPVETGYMTFRMILDEADTVDLPETVWSDVVLTIPGANQVGPMTLVRLKIPVTPTYTD